MTGDYVGRAAAIQTFTTTLANLVLLCHRHHWSVHEGGRQLIRGEGQRVLAIPPAHRCRSWTRAPDGIGAG